MPPNALLCKKSVSVQKTTDCAPDRWTQKMVQAWKAAMGSRSTNPNPITLSDLADSSNSDKKLSSPRSIQACLHLGTDPSELVKKPLEAFAGKGLRKGLVKVRYEHHEALRQEKLHKLIEERERIIEQEREKEYHSINNAPESNHTSEKAKSLTDPHDKDYRHRIENMRRRQQRELEQMAKYEAQREQIVNETQARLEAQKMAEELKKQERARKEKDWQTVQRKRELAKLKEEEAIDKRSKQLAAERYLREQEQLALEQQKQDLKIKLKQQEERHKQAEMEKKKKEALKEQQRLEIIKEAEAEREKRNQELLHKSEVADMMLQNFVMKRQLANARRVLERQLEFEDQHLRVESIERIKAVQRYQLLKRIEGERDRVRRLIEGKQAEQERHRAANVKLAIHRQAMLQKMEKLAITKKWKEYLTETDIADLEAHERKRNDHKHHRTISAIAEN
eukprot:Gb_19339 [translate_table: standard]